MVNVTPTTTSVNKISNMHSPRRMRFLDIFNEVYYYTPEEVAKFINDAFDTGRRYEASLPRVGTTGPQTKAPVKTQRPKPQNKFNAQTLVKKAVPAKAPAKKNNPVKAKPKAK